MDNLISTSEIVAKYKISYQTLNYYTNLGLLHTVKKVGNKRFYNEQKLRQGMDRIQQLKNEGYTLNLIRKALSSIDR